MEKLGRFPSGSRYCVECGKFYSNKNKYYYHIKTSGHLLVTLPSSSTVGAEIKAQKRKDEKVDQKRQNHAARMKRYRERKKLGLCQDTPKRSRFDEW